MSQLERQERRQAHYEGFLAGQAEARALYALKPMVVAVRRALSAMRKAR